MAETGGTLKPMVALIDLAGPCLDFARISAAPAAGYGFDCPVLEGNALTLPSAAGDVLAICVPVPIPTGPAERWPAASHAGAGSHLIVTALSASPDPAARLEQAKNLLAACVLFCGEIEATQLILPFRENLTLSAQLFRTAMDGQSVPAPLLVSLAHSHLGSAPAIRTQGLAAFRFCRHGHAGRRPRSEPMCRPADDNR